MLLKVIYTDGAFGTVRSANLEEMLKIGRIAAYQCSEGWVDVRRKSNSTFRREDRRRTKPELFFARFNSDKSY